MGSATSPDGHPQLAARAGARDRRRRRFRHRRSQLSSSRASSPVIYREQNFFGRITMSGYRFG
jgi:hypothetical protein